ncbi:hypothetical protein FTO74_15895 [Granulicella sp. WH15]|uniref:hypothetical protein n=1 Tax=Granulicella sp. WH15 TaxID=2602070 RepID=UPI001366D5E3|nr:hypothetical protein [Granulicella sp. WH15]QHN04674.1 hypothetical protein FTO74_15895 [Granulicella sp. WH15]
MPFDPSHDPSHQPGSKSWEQRLREAGESVETDVQRLIGYINDEVVPDIRRYGSEALRVAANELQRLAQRMDDARPPQNPPPPSKSDL